MPVFDTPEPISVAIELVVGDLRIVASERADTVVEVRPSDESDESDVKAAQHTEVEFGNGALLVRAPKPRGLGYFMKGKSASVDVSIELPQGSQLKVDAVVANLGGTGPLGNCRFTTSTGHIRLEHTGTLHLNTSAGSVTVDRVAGSAEISTGSGSVRLGELGGAATVKNSNGHTEIGTVTGELRVRSANGDITVERALAGVDARTANGGIRLRELNRGEAMLETGMGDLEVGIAKGTAAWLDAKTGYGRVRNSLAGADGAPEPSEQTAEVRARTGYGDILVGRS